ncbi:exocyst complex component 3-like protein 4 [Dendropsophus ebraccatus]|uniref:exocyst complex component 3-like protein 4 n=1 Tax=Dendropsophus ebraccatus TaxID=150705 RepID=UPI0038320BA4
METSTKEAHPKSTEDNLENGNLLKSPVKSESFLKKRFRLSNRFKKPSEEELSSPEKHDFNQGKDQSVRSGKVLMKQKPVEEPESPEKSEESGISMFRRSLKGSKKDAGSPESKVPPEEDDSLVGKLRRSIRGKKKIDYNGSEKSPTLEEMVHEDKEEHQILSVMEINGLIQSKDVRKAFESIKLLEHKLLEECGTNDFHQNVTEYTIRGRDVELLYGSLFNMIRSIVKDSLCQDHVDESLMSSLVYVINGEAETHRNPAMIPINSEVPLLGQPKGWKKLWKQAVRDSVSNRIESVSLDDREEGWFGKHLEGLKSITVKDLTKVKNSLKPLYPEDYDVYGTYARSFHEALASHIENAVIPLASEVSQLYCLLNWIVIQYRSDDFMGHPEVQEINPLSLQTLLDGECLEKLKKDYSRSLQETTRKYMNNLLEMEKKNWENGEEVEELVRSDSCHLPLYTDIEGMIGIHVRQSATLSEELETSTFTDCVEELGTFTTRLQAAFQDCVGTSFTLKFVQYTVVYVNSLTKLRHNTTQSDAEQCRSAEISLTNAIKSLKQHFFNLFIRETKAQFQKLITEHWLKKDTAFSAIMKSTEILCPSLKYLLPPHNKDFAHRIHHYLVKEYIAQIMKRKLQLKRSRRKKAAQKMKEEGYLINKAADNMGSDLDSLHHAIHCISELIGVKKTDDIKPKLDQLFQLYPDISVEHISCILYLYNTRKKGRLLEYFQKLQEKQKKNPSPQDGEQPRLFSGIECSTQMACFPLCGTDAVQNIAKDEPL